MERGNRRKNGTQRLMDYTGPHTSRKEKPPSYAEGPAEQVLRTQIPERWNAVTRQVIGAAIEVHRTLGPGLLESMYERAMTSELRSRGTPFERQKLIRAHYRGDDLGEFRLDCVVDNLVVVELKCVQNVSDVMLAQLLTYLKVGEYPLGLLINFQTTMLKHSVYRRMNVEACRARAPLEPAMPATQSNIDAPHFFDHPDFA